MTDGPARLSDQAAALRDAFDRSFTRAPHTDTADVERLLAIGIGSDRYVMRLAEVGGLFTDKKITPLPSHAPALLGIAGFRGTVLPVYDLATLLGYARAAAPRWLLLAVGAPIGLAFERFDGHLTVRADAIVREASADASVQGAREFLHGGVAVPVVRLAAVLDTIRSSGRASAG
jgi:purine-binding chemotaxis protein CheW